MAARKTKSKGKKPDKLMRDAISLELHQEVADPNNKKQKIRKLRLVARSLVNAGVAGDMTAIREINDRMDGKIIPRMDDPGNSDGTMMITGLEISFVVPKKRDD